MTRDVPVRSSRQSGFVSCGIGAKDYGMRGADACEIVRADRMRPEARADGCVGSLDLNGQAVPVYRLAAILGRTAVSAAPSASTGHYVVVTRGAGGMIGWLVDRITRFPLADAANLLPLPPMIGPRAACWFEGILRLGDQSLLVLAPQNLDPRVRASEADAFDRLPIAAVDTVADASDARAQLALIFSSPALPSCGAPRYALSVRRVAEVVQSLAIVTVPGSARYVAGVATWRDRTMLVIDFRADDGGGAGRERYLVVRCGAQLDGAPIAFAVDTEIALHGPTPDDRPVAGEQANPPFVSGLFVVGGDAVALLDVDTLLLDAASIDLVAAADRLVAGTAESSFG